MVSLLESGRSVVCKFCNSPAVVKYGKTGGVQKYPGKPELVWTTK